MSLNITSKEQAVLDRLIHWGDHQPLVRAMVLTSSRAVPGAPCDLFSDYDVILALEDIQPFYPDRAWLEASSPLDKLTEPAI